MLIVNHLASELELSNTTPEQNEVIEFDRWLQQTFGNLVEGDTLKEGVWSVIRHYATQMGRWVAEEDF